MIMPVSKSSDDEDDMLLAVRQAHLNEFHAMGTAAQLFLDDLGAAGGFLLSPSCLW